MVSSIWRFLKKQKLKLLYDLAILLLGIYPKINIIQKDTRTPTLTTTLFTIAKTLKQPKCPLTEKQIKKLWYIYAMEYYSVTKRNKIGSFAEMWKKVETVNIE